MRLRDTLDPFLLNGATANVAMQLGLRPVGHGVVHSPVESGQVFRHPLKRLRTTLSYLAVAILGTDDEVAAFRAEVEQVHRRVRSAPGAEVSYDARDRDLQLWVALCLAAGLLEGRELLHGPLDPGDADRLTAEAARLGTSLEVPASRWPDSRRDFDAVFAEGLGRCVYDDTTRPYLLALADLRQLPGWLSGPLGPTHRFLTAAFLPPTLRDGLGLAWTAADQRRFDRLVAAYRPLARRWPRAVREFPYNLCLLDVRRRIRAGKPLL